MDCTDPVIYCEHKFLYRWLKAKSINGEHLPIGQARIIRPGKHASVVTYSAMVHEAVRAADRLQQELGQHGFAFDEREGIFVLRSR